MKYKKIFLFLILSLAVITANAGCDGMKEGAVEKNTPEETWSRLIQAARNGDYELWLSLWASGTMNIDRSQPVEKQIADFREAVDPSIESNAKMYAGKVVDVDIAGDRAVLYVLVKKGNLALDPNSERPEIMIVSMVKEEGRWKIVGPDAQQEQKPPQSNELQE